MHTPLHVRLTHPSTHVPFAHFEYPHGFAVGHATHDAPQWSTSLATHSPLHTIFGAAQPASTTTSTSVAASGGGGVTALHRTQRATTELRTPCSPAKDITRYFTDGRPTSYGERRRRLRVTTIAPATARSAQGGERSFAGLQLQPPDEGTATHSLPVHASDAPQSGHATPGTHAPAGRLALLSVRGARVRRTSGSRRPRSRRCRRRSGRSRRPRCTSSRSSCPRRDRRRTASCRRRHAVAQISP